MQTLNLSDGGYISFDQAGRGQPIVLLHGWGMRREIFAAQIAALSAEFRVVVPDLRGHGESSRIENGQGLSVLVDDIAELLTHLNLSQVIVVGWSMGAMISWGLMQHAAAERISGLVSVDMVPKLLNDESWRFGLREGKDASVFDGTIAKMLADWPAFTRVFVPRIFARDNVAQRQTMIDQLVDKTESNHPPSMARLWRSMAEQDYRHEIAQLKLPTMVCYGALSQLYSSKASAWVATTIPGAKPVPFAKSGHAPHLEEAEFFNREIRNFAKQIGYRVGGKSHGATREN